MTLQQLEYVVAVNRLRQFAKAAAYCGVTQPTLSAMIQKLEAELGVRLFDRTAGRVIPTAIGEAVAERAEKTLAMARGIRDLVANEKQKVSGRFRLGILPTIAPYLLPRFLPQLCATHPEMELRVVEMKTSDICRAVRQGDLDAAILVRLDGMEEFSLQTLFYEQFMAYVSRTDKLFTHERIRTSDLNDEYLWLLDEGHCFRDQLVKFCHLKAAQSSQNTYSLGSIETFMRMVEGGKGITFIPQLALEQFSSQQREMVRPFAIPVPTREVVLMTRNDFVRDAVSRLLCQSVRAAVPKEMLKMQREGVRV
ncbi:MAG: hydrogen peroxide-inducible genes activator [Prevotellaceae bacterium]|nr:hydrogen peroxide-inducible genes activator [Prevotellaceae bacterium]MDY6099758.1 hydrogen peroxide-inducible genes activator [Bacteroidaceae bacterium]